MSDHAADDAINRMTGSYEVLNDRELAALVPVMRRAPLIRGGRRYAIGPSATFWCFVLEWVFLVAAALSVFRHSVAVTASVLVAAAALPEIAVLSVFVAHHGSSVDPWVAARVRRGLVLVDLVERGGDREPWLGVWVWAAGTWVDVGRTSGPWNAVVRRVIADGERHLDWLQKQERQERGWLRWWCP